MKKIKAKNLQEAKKKVDELTDEEQIQSINQDIKTIAINLPEILSIYGFWQYLIDKNKDKAYLTTKRTPVWKHRKTLKKIHNCKIKAIEDIKK